MSSYEDTDGVLGHTIDNENSIIYDPEFIPIPPECIDYNDLVIVYNDGIDWKLIPIKVLNMYPIIYDYYYEKIHLNRSSQNTKEKKIFISITYCPFSRTLRILKGKFRLSGEIYKNNIILVDDDENKIIQLSGKYVNTSKTLFTYEVNMIEFSKSLKSYQDIMYLSTMKNREAYVSKNYLNDDHPQFPLNATSKLKNLKLAYGIDYISKKMTTSGNNEHKTILLIPPNEIDFELVQNYIDKNYTKIVERRAIIIPTSIATWMSHFPNTHVIFL